MCRHIAYLGPEIPIGKVLLEPPYGLYRQSWAPRHQRHGTVNADGFGVGWYAPGDPVPARYRRAGPIWADECLPGIARVVRTGALLGAVRDATESGADAEAAAAPFAGGHHLFSHNGAVRGWPDALAPLTTALPPVELLRLAARCDAAFCWALIQHRLAVGDDQGRALAHTVAAVAEAAPGSRLTFLMTDGTAIAATTWGDTLFHLSIPGGGTVVASEPYDDSPHWTEVPDRTLLRATRTEVRLTPLEEPAP
ncbi:ergothioneine biosynthesis protein EgtC [Streptomyces pinistramenti]|uniref:ergothioneine biosynthesis protein EgtC n=1 Tax=Streptomyces pinistramenti TaxID=2884812 RepID=UPI001D084789|nr:ergothioneine biosynthesis protein EgtC [Streptomyces pinistramenti]MCB5910249.1 ergothioneine biosynthesis protein EgtC [Streptomyces pinistramenti]